MIALTRRRHVNLLAWSAELHSRARGVYYGQSPIRTGLTKVGLPGADVGLQLRGPERADFLKNLGYATGQFGENHLGDLNK